MGLFGSLLSRFLPSMGPGGQIAAVLNNVSQYFDKIDFSDSRLRHTMDGMPVSIEDEPDLQVVLSGAPAVFGVTVRYPLGELMPVSGACALHIPKMNKTIMESSEWVNVNGDTYNFPDGNVSFSLKPSQLRVFRVFLEFRWKDAETDDMHNLEIQGFLFLK
jgi:hypothetical protein